MSYLLDTNVISELRKSSAMVNPNVDAWARDHDLDSMFLSAISVYELELDIARKQRANPGHATKLREWFDGVVLPMFRGRILALDDNAARLAAPMGVPDPRPLADCLIAATAISHGLAVVTRNVADFYDLGVAVINPWEP